MKRLRDLIGDCRGATAIEYGLIISLVVIGMVGALHEFANTSTLMWNNVATQVANVAVS